MTPPRRTEGEPHDRLTHICDAMERAFQAHPEHRPGDRCVVFIEDDERGGLVVVDYDDDHDAIAAVFVHLRAMFEANGQRLELITVPDDASGLDV